MKLVGADVALVPLPAGPAVGEDVGASVVFEALLPAEATRAIETTEKKSAKSRIVRSGYDS